MYPRCYIPTSLIKQTGPLWIFRGFIWGTHCGTQWGSVGQGLNWGGEHPTTQGRWAWEIIHSPGHLQRGRKQLQASENQRPTDFKRHLKIHICELNETASVNTSFCLLKSPQICSWGWLLEACAGWARSHYWAAAWIWFLSIDTGEKKRKHEILAWPLPSQQEQPLSSFSTPHGSEILSLNAWWKQGHAATFPCTHLQVLTEGKRAFALPTEGSRWELVFWAGDAQILFQRKVQFQQTCILKIISLCLIPSFNVEWLQFGTCKGQYLSNHYAAWGLTLYQNSCRGCCQNAK